MCHSYDREQRHLVFCFLNDGGNYGGVIRRNTLIICYFWIASQATDDKLRLICCKFYEASPNLQAIELSLQNLLPGRFFSSFRR